MLTLAARLLRLLLGCGLTGGLLAAAAPQLQFREAGKAHLPRLDAGTGPVLIADVDGDRDRDLFFPRLTTPRLYLNDGSAVFADASRFPGFPTSPITGAFADVDGDGDLDLLLFGISEARLYLNDGAGRFSNAPVGATPGPGGYAQDAAFFDADGDGDLDCVIVFGTASADRLWLNDGSGRFVDAPAGRMPVTGQWAAKIAIGDLDADGDLDVIAGQAVLINTAGAFRDETTTRMPLPLLGIQLQPTAADVDGDGDLDLLCETVPLGQTRLLINDGTGHFTDGTAGRVALGVVNAALGDLDGDGDLDILANAQRVLFNDGRGVFFETGAPHVPEHCDGYVAQLFDADGDGDLDAVTRGAPLPGLFLNDGRGNFHKAAGTPCIVGVGGRGLVPVDIDADGDLDLLALGNEPFLAINDGDGGFSRAVPGRLPVFGFYQGSAAAAGDVDGDGDADLVLSGDVNAPWFRLLLNDGRGFYTDAPAGRLTHAPDLAVAVILLDVDGDRDLDLVTASYSRGCALLLNDGRGTFVPVTATHLPTFTDGVASVAAGDVDGNGAPDLFLACADAQPRLWVNDGTGHFLDWSARLPQERLRLASASLGDIDNDGDIDLLGLSPVGWPSAQARLYLNDGRSHFVDASTRLPPMPYAYGGGLHDVDGDGDLDVLTGAALWVNDGSGRFTDATVARTAFGSEQIYATAFADFDDDGDVDVANSLGWLRVYVNHRRQMSTPLLARLGRSYPVSFDAGPGFAPPGQVGIALLGGGRLSTPLPIGTLGRLRLDPSAGLVVLGAVSIPPGAGTATLPLTLPRDARLQNAHLHLQGLLMHAADPSTWRLTNAVRDRVLP